ncbi:MAG: hypothetical protein ACOC44_20720 [Promethearchaeia archaeon]
MHSIFYISILLYSAVRIYANIHFLQDAKSLRARLETAVDWFKYGMLRYLNQFPGGEVYKRTLFIVSSELFGMLFFFGFFLSKAEPIFFSFMLLVGLFAFIFCTFWATNGKLLKYPLPSYLYTKKELYIASSKLKDWKSLIRWEDILEIIINKKKRKRHAPYGGGTITYFQFEIVPKIKEPSKG